MVLKLTLKCFKHGEIENKAKYEQSLNLDRGFVIGCCPVLSIFLYVGKLSNEKVEKIH